MKVLKFFAAALALVLFAGPASPAPHDIYPDPGQAKADLARALKTAAASHKRILVDFGGNWCSDCRILDIYFHNAQNRDLLEKNFVLVRINIGEMDQNLDLAERYGIPIRKGVPALAVLSEKGHLLYSQSTGQFEAMDRIEPSQVTQFLLRWKPGSAPCPVVMKNC